MIKNRTVTGGRQFWDHCEKLAAEVATWPGWMRGGAAATDLTVDGKLYHDKPTLRLGAHDHAQGVEPRADRPLRLERNRDGIYYWSMVRAGEYHWWLTIKSTDSVKTS